MGITDPTQEHFKDGLWGWVTDQWRKLIADATGHLQVDVVTSGLPSGGATAANQATMITALQLIDDLRNALNSIATDELDVVFDGQNTDVEVTQTTAADLTPGIQGWDGAAWRKLSLLWGYSDRYTEYETSANVDAGLNILTFTTVPTGEVWTITHAAMWADQSNPTLIGFYLWDGTLAQKLSTAAYPTAFLTHHLPAPITLKAEDKLQAYFFSCAANDDIYATAFGYKMKVTE